MRQARPNRTEPNRVAGFSQTARIQIDRLKRTYLWKLRQLNGSSCSLQNRKEVVSLEITNDDMIITVTANNATIFVLIVKNHLLEVGKKINLQMLKFNKKMMNLVQVHSAQLQELVGTNNFEPPKKQP